MSDKRISVYEVLAAYKATGRRPGTGTAYGEGEICGMGAMYLQARVSGKVKADRYRWAQDTYGIDYSNGFIDGFDDFGNEPGIGIGTHANRDRKQGYADGIAAAAAVFAPEATT